MTEHLVTDMEFESLALEPRVLAGVKDAGFTRCMPIQAATLPRALDGHDVAGQAQTGTGKTAAFLLAAMHRLLTCDPPTGEGAGQPRAIMLAPTRELAVQIHKDAVLLGKHTGLRVGVVYGGEGYDSQREMLRAGIDVLIGTPGRLIDYFKQGIFNLKGIQVVVLDEADRMFDLGFIKDIRYLFRRMPQPHHRQNMLFSATLSMRVMELAYEHMNDPEITNTSPERRTVEKVAQRLYHVSKDEKIGLLVGLLRRMDVTRTIVFINTKRGGERVSAYLEGNGVKAGLLTGDVPQRKRLRLLQQFSEGEVPVLVATDVAARGLHIPDVSHVINFDLPQDAEDYVHRIGRTARAGASGDAVSFGCEEFVFSLPEIEAYIEQAIPTEPVTDDLIAKLDPPVKRPRRKREDHAGGPRGGRRHGHQRSHGHRARRSGGRPDT